MWATPSLWWNTTKTSCVLPTTSLTLALKPDDWGDKWFGQATIDTLPIKPTLPTPPTLHPPPRPTVLLATPSTISSDANASNSPLRAESGIAKSPSKERAKTISKASMWTSPLMSSPWSQACRVRENLPSYATSSTLPFSNISTNRESVLENFNAWKATSRPSLPLISLTKIPSAVPHAPTPSPMSRPTMRFANLWPNKPWPNRWK